MVEPRGASLADWQAVLVGDSDQLRSPEQRVQNDETNEGSNDSREGRKPAPAGLDQVDPVLSERDESDDEDWQMKAGEHRREVNLRAGVGDNQQWDAGVTHPPQDKERLENNAGD